MRGISKVAIPLGRGARRGVLITAAVAALILCSLAGAVSASAAAPAVTIEPAGEVTYTTAEAKGTVDAGGKETSYHFEYVPQAQFESLGWEFAPQTETLTTTTTVTPEAELNFLNPGTTYHLRLVAENEDSAGTPSEALAPTFTTEPVTPPVVTTDDASAVTGRSAKFTGSVAAGNTNQAFAASCTFEYVNDASFQQEGFGGATQTTGCTEPSIGSVLPTPVEAEATGLVPNTTYHLRLRASNLGGETSVEAPDTFTTDQVEPTIFDTGATGAGTSSAILSAKIQAGGAPTTYHFEYLSLSAYQASGGSFAGAAHTPETSLIAADDAPHLVTASIEGLVPATAYRFRVVASNALGTLAGAVAGFITTGGASGPAGCGNEQLRAENSSLLLPDCRAYELVSPDLNHASLGSDPGGLAFAGGEGIAYQTIDAPENAHSASTFNVIRALRDPVTGWHGASVEPPLSEPTTAYLGTAPRAVAPDGSASVVGTDQPLSGEAGLQGLQTYVGSPTTGYERITKVGTPIFPFLDIYTQNTVAWTNQDLSQVFLSTAVPQLPEDPTAGPNTNTYHWSKAGGLKLLTILPDGTPAPNGGFIAVPDQNIANIGMSILAPATQDGRFAIFTAEGHLYLRIDDSRTVQLDLSQRTTPDPNPPAAPESVGITADAKTVLFTSHSELTDDADTGEDGAGNPTDAGNDLYSYDVASGKLTDLTVSTDPSDVAAGANVQRVAGVTADGSRIYFIAQGVLAPGGQTGRDSLYLLEGGQIRFLADAEGYAGTPGSPVNPPQPLFSLTPDGRYFAFQSTKSLTGYDNRDPRTGVPHSEVYEGDLDGNLVCVSCRPDGTRPTADSTLPWVSQTWFRPGRALHTISDDGRRVFFDSTDRVIPAASGARQKVFEYEDGKVSLISSGNSAHPSAFLDASPSGDDAFFMTYDELVTNRNGGDMAVYDARVNGGFAQPEDITCKASDCQSATPTPALPVIGSLAFSAGGGKAAGPAKVTATRPKTIKGTAGTIKVKVPGKGRLTASGGGLRTVRISVGKARTVKVRVALNGKATKALKRHHIYKTRVKVSFAPSEGKASSVALPLTFKSVSTRKGA